MIHDVGHEFQSPHYINGGLKYDRCVRYICDQIGWGEFRSDYFTDSTPLFT